MLSAPSLPIVRQDLKLHEIEQDRDGLRRWLLHDPVAHRFYRLSDKAIELLPFINGRSQTQAAQAASNQLQRSVQGDDLQELARFLRSNDLVHGDREQQQQYTQRREAKSQGLVWLLKNYLFIRIPLANPDRWLAKHASKMAWLGQRGTLWALLGIFLIAGWLTLRQWDSFHAGFNALGQAAGWLTMGVALIFVKILHELGHAFVAKYKGVRVPTIGLAFIVGWPVLYTDTSDAWRLTRAKDRVQVDAAGVAVELGVAVLALLFWHLLPEGLFRNLCFWLATTTWIMSVLVNFNPLMRFDGYHLLADAWRKPNLEIRSQALARWKLREWLFGFGESPPERPERRLIFFAFSVWLYRLILFIGIALAVYHFFFKLLGIILFVVEIWYFVLRPITNEVRQWFSQRRRPRLNAPLLRTTLLLSGLIMLLFWPWQTHLRVPAFLSQTTTQIEAPVGGTIELAVEAGQAVTRGAELATIHSPEISHQLTMAQLQLKQLDWQLRTSGLNSELLSSSPLTRAERDAQQRRVMNLQSQQAIGALKSPSNGVVQAISPAIREDSWVGKGEYLMTLNKPGQLKLTAWITEENVLRLETGQTATFYPLAPAGPPVPVTVLQISQHAAKRLDAPQMADQFGGPIPVREDGDGNFTPLRSLYQATFAIPASSRSQAEAIASTARRGVIRVETQARSLTAALWRNIVGVWRRESGF